MSTEATDEPECESVAAARLVEDSVKLADTIKPSDEFLRILNLSHTFNKEPGTFSKKKVKTMETKMEMLYDKVIKSENTSLDDIVTLAHSYGILSHTYLSFKSKKDIATAKYFNLRKMNLIKDKELHPKSILIALRTCYQLAHIFVKQQNFNSAIKSYDKGVELYFTYTRENKEYDTPIDIQDIIITESPAVNGYKKLRILYINLLEMAIQFHKSQLPESTEYLIAYKHLLLVAQLSKLPETKNYSDFIQDAVKLQYELVKQNRFTEAKNHLTTAFLVKKIYFDVDDVRKRILSSPVFIEYKILTACFVISWITYGIRLLRSSTARLLRLQADTANDLKLKYPNESMSHIFQTLISFAEMKDNPFPNVFDQSMMVKSISGYDDAHKLFVHTLSQLKNINFFFDIIKYIMSSRTFILDISNVYKYMAPYEEDTSQILLQNRHVEILSETLRKQIHLEQSLALKNIKLQLAIGYSILIDTKLENFEETALVYMPQRYYAIMCEIGDLVKKALMNLKMYTQPVESQ